MKHMTNKEIMLLGKDLIDAKILVLHKHGFTYDEISQITNIGESVIKRVISSNETK